MKKFFCLTFVLLTAISIFAQERNIEKAEFDAVMKYRFVKFARQSYRITTNYENIPNATNKNKMTSKSLREYVPSQQSRMLYEFNSPAVKTRLEIIKIGGKTYARKDGGDWTEESPEQNTDKIPEPARALKTVEEQIEYKAFGIVVLNDLKVSIYGKIERKKLVSESNKSEMFSTLVTKYWLDEDGGIIKEETSMENRFKSEKMPAESVYRHLRTSIWEFDPNIRIEAPVVAK